MPPSENESVRYLASYLDYAERGMEALTLQLGPSGLGTESPFEDSVIDAIRSRGYDVEPQVGAAGYRIDMGIRHPAHPGVFALGIECDGYMYHSSPAARDRDRLREQVLRGLGWNLYRIWGTSWYRNRSQEEERLVTAINAAIAAPIRGRLSGLADQVGRPTVTTEEIERLAAPSWTTPYEMATVSPLPRWINASDPGSRFDMIPGIEEIARVEGPVHIAVIHQRLRDAWDIGRVGVKIRENIEAAITHAEVIRNGDFIDIPLRDFVTARTPTDTVARTVEQICPDELANALVNLVNDGGTVNKVDLMTGTARVYGWNRRGTDITTYLSFVIDALIENGSITGDASALTIPSDE
jgi:very-short-patch-repair endonuclease